MNWQAYIFLGLVSNQLLATTVFIAMYLRESDWQRSAVGRHLLYWPLAAGALDLSWVLLLLVQWPWLVFVLFAAQAVVGLLTWQRVRLVWRLAKSQAAEFER